MSTCLPPLEAPSSDYRSGPPTLCLPACATGPRALRTHVSGPPTHSPYMLVSMHFKWVLQGPCTPSPYVPGPCAPRPCTSGPHNGVTHQKKCACAPAKPEHLQWPTEKPDPRGQRQETQGRLNLWARLLRASTSQTSSRLYRARK